MASKSINQLFYDISHYDPAEEMGDHSTALNSMLEEQYIPMAVKIYNAITDEGLVLMTGAGPPVYGADYASFGTTSEFENQVAAYIACYLAEVDLNPKELHSDMSTIWASKYMQQALQLLQTVYPDRIEAQPVGGVGMIWILKPMKTNNISLMLGVMHNRADSTFGTDPGDDSPEDSDAGYGR